MAHWHSRGSPTAAVLKKMVGDALGPSAANEDLATWHARGSPVFVGA